ncbi:MAG TPA: IPT/TIG domain-containing protein [Myxococcales bacterium]|jgi:hypothetical protein
MRPLPRRVLALVLLVSGCMVEPVDFTGKTCSAAADCPDGLQCNGASHQCVPPSGLDASLARLDAGLDAALPPDAGELMELDADVEPPDAQKPGRDAGTPTADTGADPDGGTIPNADGALPSDTGAVRVDASTVGSDSGLAPADAGAPRPDASVPADAGGCGLAARAPLLQRVGPAAVTAGSPEVSLSLGGANFDPCSKVLVGGAPVAATWLGPTEMSARVPAAMLVDPGVLPVQVVSTGLLGDLASNPNAVLLASKTLSGNPAPIGAVVLDTGALAVANYGTKTLMTFDGETLAGPNSTFATSNQPETLVYGAGKLWYANNKSLMVVTDPLGTPTTTTLNLSYDFVDLDVDDDFGTLLVAEANSRYQTVDLVTQAATAAVQVTGTWLMGFQAAGLDMSRGLAVFPSQVSTFVVPVGDATASYTASNTSGYGLAIDRGAGVAYVGGATSIRRVALSPGSTLANVAVPLPMRVLRHNPLSRRIVATPSGETDLSYSVGLIDAEAGTLAGYLGAGAQRGCGPNNSYRVEGLAVDPLHNRAYATASCDDTIEAYNLNVLLVVLPAPTIATFSPASRAAPSPSFTLKVTGTGFHPTAKVTYGAQVPTNLSITPTEITFTAPASTCGGSKNVVVANTDPGRGTATKAFSVTMGTPTALTTSFSGGCTSGLCTSGTITVNGLGFTSGCSVIHAGTDTATGTGSASAITGTVTLCAGAVGSATDCGLQSLDVYVTNPGGGTSNTLKLAY